MECRSTARSDPFAAFLRHFGENRAQPRFLVTLHSGAGEGAFHRRPSRAAGRSRRPEMKRYYAAAGALLLGTSALAWAGSADKTTIEPIVTSDAKLEMSSGKFVTTDAKPFLVADSDLNVKKQWTPVYATLDQDLAKLALAETGAKLQTASADSWSDTDSGAKIETAALEDKVVADADA